MKTENSAFTKTKNKKKEIAFFFNKLAQFEVNYMMYIQALLHSIYGRNMRYKLSGLDN